MKSYKYIYSTENGIRENNIEFELVLKKNVTPTRFKPVSSMIKQNKDSLVFVHHWATLTYLSFTIKRII